GVELLSGYRAAFYSAAVMGGVCLIVVVLLAANHDPSRSPEENNSMSGKATVGSKANEDQLEHGEDKIGYSSTKEDC
ncbi:hypothetical protein BX616_005571, partial [Lobosporangium transversale]